jgi:hypothetical protein
LFGIYTDLSYDAPLPGGPTCLGLPTK